MKKLAAILTAGALCGTLLVTAPAALAQGDLSHPTRPDAHALLRQAYAATVSSLQRQGGSIVVDESANRDRVLFGRDVQAGRQLEYAYGASSSGEYSIAVTDQGAAIGFWGNNARNGRWSTLGAAGPWASDFIRNSPLTLITAVTGMDRRLDMDAADAASRQIMIDLALPPGASSGGRSWSAMRATVSNSATVITARAHSKSCRYGSISIRIRAGLIANSSWTSTCGASGRISRSAVWSDHGGATGPFRLDVVTQAQAMATSANPSASNSWKSLTRAANDTAATSWSDITRVMDSTPTNVEHQVPVVESLRLLDVLIRNGATGVVRAPADNGAGTYLITASGSNGYFLTVGDTKYAGGTITIGADGRISAMHLGYLQGDHPDGETITFVR